MDFDLYQRRANRTDLNPGRDLIIPLLGLVGEAGTLHTEYKKLLRDKDDFKDFVPHFKEELGDILWYVSNIANKLDLKLRDIAIANLKKIHLRWPHIPHRIIHFDKNFPSHEKFPRFFSVLFKQKKNGKKILVEISINGVPLGDRLNDNSHEDDGYRYHDAFHLAYAAILGWSPVIRSLMRRKRKSNAKIDEVEDGARAINVEEGITAYVYNQAKNSNMFRNTKVLDFSLLKTINSFVMGLEVAKCSFAQWEKAILEGFKVYHKLKKNKGGLLILDLNKRTISYRKR